MVRLTMKGALTHQICVQGRLTSHLSASMIPTRWFLTFGRSCWRTILSFSCVMQHLIYKRVLLVAVLFLFVFSSSDLFYLLWSSTKAICIALSRATLRYLFGTLSSEMFWSRASWGCSHHCHFLIVFSFYLCSWNSPSGGKGSFFYQQNQHRALSWSNTTKQEVAITPTTVSNISVFASNSSFPGTPKTLVAP